MSYVDFSPVYRLGPVGLTFDRVVGIRVFDSNENEPLTGIAIQQSKAGTPCTFEPVADTYLNAGFVQASITETGYFFVGKLKSPEQAMCP